MRVRKGRVVLDKRDHRIGNFVFTKESEHIKVSDIGGAFSHRVLLDTPKGAFLDIMLGNNPDGIVNDDILRLYATVMHNLLGVVPDVELMDIVNTSCVDCLDRHPELYGIDPEISEEDDAEIIEDMKSMQEIEDKILSESEEGE